MTFNWTLVVLNTSGTMHIVDGFQCHCLIKTIQAALEVRQYVLRLHRVNDLHAARFHEALVMPYSDRLNRIGRASGFVADCLLFQKRPPDPTVRNRQSQYQNPKNARHPPSPGSQIDRLDAPEVHDCAPVLTSRSRTESHVR